jgi:hypothetical protein
VTLQPDLETAFAPTYASARDKFREAASAAGLAIERHVNSEARGAEGEELSTDVAVWGDASARAALLLTSATHGVEGFCGSGCQVALLRDAAVRDAVAQSGVAVILYHALNPYGFSHLSRTDERNVDLNRNFRDFRTRSPVNAAYAEVHGFIVPTSWPPGPDTESLLGKYVATRGPRALQQAVTGGQCEYRDGLFYGGDRPSFGNGVLRDVLRRHGAQRARLGWIDFHTGLGPAGHGEKIFSGPNDAAMIARAGAWFGDDVTSFYDGSSTSASLTGVTFQAALDECPNAEYTGIALEYGTLPLETTLAALRGDQWLRNQRDPPQAAHASVKRMMRDAFYTDTPEWRGMVYGQARVAVLQALKGLAAR